MALAYKLDFEKPLQEVDDQIAALESAPSTSPGLEKEIAGLRKSRQQVLKKIYSSLQPWDTVRVARHPERPQTRDYLEAIVKDFCEIHGDRRYGDDPAVVAGFGRIGSRKCVIIGHHKGRETPEKLASSLGVLCDTP
ncbi:MAG: acetyl-CoA carboxylase carboxyl transferase subunit alpha, partial [Planctomycetota bacterium]